MSAIFQASWFALVLCAVVRVSSHGGSKNGVVVILLSNHHDSFLDATSVTDQWREDIRSAVGLEEADVTFMESWRHFTDAEIHMVVLMLPRLLAEHGNRAEWFLFVTKETDINFNMLEKFISEHQENDSSIDSRSSLWFGYSLQDQQPTILHHFANSPLSFPLLCSGFMLNTQLLHRCAVHATSFNPTFTIDPSYEMAQFFKYLRYPKVSELHPSPPAVSDEGALLTNSSYFCPAHSTHPHCMTRCRAREAKKIATVDNSSVLIAVKTCQKNHQERLDILHQTWDDGTIRVQYYSDITDTAYDTIDTGVPNTERGHCTKLLAIIGMAVNSMEFDWLVVADDDTLLSVPRLLTLLSGRDHTIPIVLGELYGYNLHRNHGYLYPTGGAGIGISRVAAEMIVQSGIICPSHDYADDMFLGIIVKRLNITITHIPQLHQDQPTSYHPTLLASQGPPVSFHHFTPRDPITVYDVYLKADETKEKRRRRTEEL